MTKFFERQDLLGCTFSIRIHSPIDREVEQIQHIFVAYFFTERENGIEIAYYTALDYPVFIESETTIITSASECYIAKRQDVVADVVLGCYLSIRIVFCL